MHHFLVHDRRDTVGVAVVDIRTGQTVSGKALDGSATFELTALQNIPLGHKIALKDFKPGDSVTKYGEDIGKVIQNIRAGEHVHVHNLKTKRW